MSSKVISLRSVVNVIGYGGANLRAVAAPRNCFEGFSLIWKMLLYWSSSFFSVLAAKNPLGEIRPSSCGILGWRPTKSVQRIAPFGSWPKLLIFCKKVHSIFYEWIQFLSWIVNDGLKKVYIYIYIYIIYILYIYIIYIYIYVSIYIHIYTYIQIYDYDYVVSVYWYVTLSFSIISYR